MNENNTENNSVNKNNHSRKGVTTGVVLSVIAVIICVFVILGGIDSEGDISDIFISNENENDDKISGNSVPVYYSDGKTEYSLKFDRNDNVILTYYNNGMKSEIYCFSFDNSDRPVNIVKGENEKIVSYIYKEDNITEEIFYSDSKADNYNEITKTAGYENSVKTDTDFYDKNGNLLYSTQFITDRNGNITSYSYFNKNGEKVTGYEKSYIYNENGNIQNINIKSFDDKKIHCVYEYDERNNLTYSAVMNNDLSTAVTTYSYDYDDKGNILGYTENESLPKERIYIYTLEYENGKCVKKNKSSEDATVISSEISEYDEKGNLISTVYKSYENNENTNVKYTFYSDYYYSRMNYVLSYWNFENRTVNEYK